METKNQGNVSLFSPRKQSECLFSIMLRNGIVISGADPYQVRDWLDIVSSVACSHSLVDDPEMYWSRRLADSLFDETNNALVTINKRMKGL